MAIENSVFFRMTNENEDSTTELLANLIRKFKFLRSSVIQFLCENCTKELADEVSENSIVTQRVIEGIGKPDLKIKTENLYIIVENKIRIGTAPTFHEIEDYIKEIKEFNSSHFEETNDSTCSKVGKLVFLIPEQYGHISVIQDVQKRNSHLVSIVYWEDFISWLKNQEFNLFSPIISEAIDYFESIVSLGQINEESRELKPYEVIMLHNLDKVFDAITLIDQLMKKISVSEASILKRLNTYFDSKKIPVELSASDYQFDYKDNGVPQLNKGGVGKYFNISFNGRRKDYFCYYGFNNLDDRTNTKSFGFSVAFHKTSSSGFMQFERITTHDSWTFVPIPFEVLIDSNTSDFENSVFVIIKTIIDVPDFSFEK